MRLWLLLLVVTLGLAAPASAQSADDDEAHSLYDAGRQAFEAGRYDRALEDFHHAYELSPRPELLYNIGQAADRLRHDQEALDAFEQYLASGAVDETLRPQIEGRVEVLRAAIAAQPAPVPVADAPAAPPPPGGDPTAGIAVLVTGGVLAAAGIVMLAIAGSENGTVQNAPQDARWSEFSGHLETANALAISGGVALGLGAIGCVVGAVLIATTPSASTSVAIGPGSITLRGTF